MKSRRCLATWAVVLFTLCNAAALRAEEVPAGFEKPDVVIDITAVPAKMHYDREAIYCKPGAKVKLTFNNPDVMEHNLVICKPGKTTVDDVAKLALAMGGDGPAKSFIPATPLVLFHTTGLAPGSKQTIYFTAPETEGDYPYICTLPGHVFLMHGILTISNTPPLTLRDIKYRYFHGSWSSLPNFDKLKPEASGELNGGLLETTFVKAHDNFGIAYDATLDIPADGKYGFNLKSDDGSNLLIDGSVVIDNDGSHPPTAKRGSVHLTKGEHKLRVNYFQGGVGWELALIATSPTGKRTPLTVAQESESGDNQLEPKTETLVVRSHLAGSGSRSISVGFPDGVNYVFDAETGSVRFGWTGGFLDVTGDRTGRGGNATQILGTRFNVGDDGFPLRFSANTEKPAFEFHGYQRGEAPRFFLSADGVNVIQKITPVKEGTGLTYSFELSKVTGPVRFVVQPEGLKLSASAGTWDGGVLTVPAEQAKSFSVTIIAAP